MRILKIILIGLTCPTVDIGLFLFGLGIFSCIEKGWLGCFLLFAAILVLLIGIGEVYNLSWTLCEECEEKMPAALFENEEYLRNDRGHPICALCFQKHQKGINIEAVDYRFIE